MARTPAHLPAGLRLGDHISLGVIAEAVPLARLQILVETGTASQRGRDLPAHVMVYFFPPHSIRHVGREGLNPNALESRLTNAIGELQRGRTKARGSRLIELWERSVK